MWNQDLRRVAPLCWDADPRAAVPATGVRGGPRLRAYPHPAKLVDRAPGADRATPATAPSSVRTYTRPSAVPQGLRGYLAELGSALGPPVCRT